MEVALIFLGWLACVLIAGTFHGYAKDRDRRLGTGELPDAARRLAHLAEEYPPLSTRSPEEQTLAWRMTIRPLGDEEL